MTEQQSHPDERHPASNSRVLFVLFWGYVTVPLIWALYRTFGNISALFTG